MHPKNGLCEILAKARWAATNSVPLQRNGASSLTGACQQLEKGGGFLTVASSSLNAENDKTAAAGTEQLGVCPAGVCVALLRPKQPQAV